MEQMINLTIDNVKVSVPAGTTVLEAAKQAGINIPTLCYLKDVNAIGACRMCVVNAGGRGHLHAVNRQIDHVFHTAVLLLLAGNGAKAALFHT